ncbi:surfactin synthase thioesterase subunit [Burkholderia ambifaria]|nr:alpha/beta fold hydrolase [Burkholderia ambifaria]MDR6504218.1 surfactin synthase thioesterase subunit [Burkholderia ambifaria]
MNDAWAPTSAWLDATPSASRATRRLFCFPYAGGSAAVFRGWSERLPAAVDVRPLHPPGRGRRFPDPLLHSIDELADEAAEAIAPLLDRPYALFGHSMGASVAFEVAQRLRGRPAPACLIVSGRGAPHLPPKGPPIHRLPDVGFLDEVMRMDGTPPDLVTQPDIVKIILPILRADFEAIETYRPEPHPPLDCRIVALGGRDEVGSVAAVASWRDYGTGEFRGELVPGDHFFLRGRAERFFEILNEELG